MEFKNTKEYQEIKSICSETIEEFSKFFSLHSKDFMVSSFFSNQQNSYVYTKSKPHLKESLVPPRNRSNLFAPSSKPKFSCILKGWKEVNLFSRYGVYEIEVSTSLHHPPYTIYKRYREFYSLYKELSKIINRSGVKYSFPSTSSNQKFFQFKKNDRKFDPEFHSRRGSELQIFLKLLCEYEPTCNHPKFHQFLYFDMNYNYEIHKIFDASIQSLLDHYDIVNTQFFSNSMEETLSSILMLRLQMHFEKIKKKSLPVRQFALKSFNSLVSKYSKKVYDIIEESKKLKNDLETLKSFHSDVVMKTKYRIEEDIIDKRKNIPITVESLKSMNFLIEEISRSLIPEILKVIFGIIPKINNFIDSIDKLIVSDKEGYDLLNEISILINTCSSIRKELIDNIKSIKNSFILCTIDNELYSHCIEISQKIKILPDIFIKTIECYINPRYFFEMLEKFLKWTNKLKKEVHKKYVDKPIAPSIINEMSSVQINDTNSVQNNDTPILDNNNLIENDESNLHQNDLNNDKDNIDKEEELLTKAFEDERIDKEFLDSFLDQFENDMMSTINQYYESFKLSSKNVLSFIKMNYEYPLLIDLFLDFGISVSNIWLNYFKKLTFKFSDYITIMSFIVHPTNFDQALKDCIVVGFTKANSYGNKAVMNILDKFLFDIETFLLSDLINNITKGMKGEFTRQEVSSYLPERLKSILDIDNILSSSVSQFIRRRIEPFLTKNIFEPYKDEVTEKVICQLTEMYEKRVVLEYQLSNALYNEIVSNNIHIAKKEKTHEKESSLSSSSSATTSVIEQKSNNEESSTTTNESENGKKLTESESSDIKNINEKSTSDSDLNNQEIIKDELKERKKMLPKKPKTVGKRVKARSNTVQLNQEEIDIYVTKERSNTTYELPSIFNEESRRGSMNDISIIKTGKSDESGASPPVPLKPKPGMVKQNLVEKGSILPKIPPKPMKKSVSEGKFQ